MTLSKDVEQWRQKNQKPLLVILGATASGKTTFSIELALQIPGAEIINADSRQLYKYMDIGTAKITNEEMKGVPHHLLSIVDPKEPLTVARYQAEARKVIGEIHAGGGLPILVGGSMLYISSVVDGYEFAGASNPALRAKLAKQLEEEGEDALYEELCELDPEKAKGIDARNHVYLLRALEVAMSDQKSEDREQKTESRRQRAGHQSETFIIGIDRPRDELHERINQRTQHMLESGWVEEVQSLLQQGYARDDPGMLSHGYRDVIDFLEGKISSKQELAERISAQARQYARRQMTWWRPDARIQWIKI